MRAELERRASLADRLWAYFQARPYQAILASELGRTFGQAWRSRLPKVRQWAKASGGSIPWNQQNAGASAYIYRPQQALGRDASDYKVQPGLWT